MEAFVLWHRTAPTAHDEDTDPAAESAWIRRVRGRLEGAGASIVGPVGGSIAAIFHAEDGAKAPPPSPESRVPSPGTAIHLVGAHRESAAAPQRNRTHT